MIERTIPAATEEDLREFGHLFISTAKHDMFDAHIWLSVVSRPTRSHFTRVQRLACGASLLYLTMIANAMFYRTEENVQGTKQVGGNVLLLLLLFQRNLTKQKIYYPFQIFFFRESEQIRLYLHLPCKQLTLISLIEFFAAFVRNTVHRTF